jgi:CRISPR-associated protein Csd1
MERDDPAYRLGRLFAVIEKVQGDALGNVNATVRDRFYGAASATPAVVFPRLLRTYQHHLAKLSAGMKIVRERLSQEILGPIRKFPAHLNLEQQGLFALGYYHQAKDLWTAKEKKETEGGEA